MGSQGAGHAWATELVFANSFSAPGPGLEYPGWCGLVFQPTRVPNSKGCARRHDGRPGVPAGEFTVPVGAGRQEERAGSLSGRSHSALLCRAGLVHGGHHPAKPVPACSPVSVACPKARSVCGDHCPPLPSRGAAVTPQWGGEDQNRLACLPQDGKSPRSPGCSSHQRPHEGAEAVTGNRKGRNRPCLPRILKPPTERTYINWREYLYGISYLTGCSHIYQLI